MDDLPLELIVHILQYLNKKEQLKFSIVNKKFHKAVLSPSLWTENEKGLVVPPNRIKSFRKFLKQLPWLRYLNLEFRPIVIKERRLIEVNLPSVLKPLKKLEHLRLELYYCKSSESYFPNTLKQISLYDCADRDTSFINDDLLKSLADSCPLLEYIEIDSQTHAQFSRQCLQYLLDKVKDRLQTLILSDCFDGDPIFGFIDCPPNVATLYFQTFSDKNFLGKLNDLQNLEILQVLALEYCFFICNEDFNEKLSMPNLQILYLNDCLADFDVLSRFIACCPSLKVLAWREPSYMNKALSELEKLSKEKSVKVYLSFTADPFFCDEDEPVHNFYPFPNENFLCFDTFYKDYFTIHFISNFFKGHGIVPH